MKKREREWLRERERNQMNVNALNAFATVFDANIFSFRWWFGTNTKHRMQASIHPFIHLFVRPYFYVGMSGIGFIACKHKAHTTIIQIVIIMLTVFRFKRMYVVCIGLIVKWEIEREQYDKKIGDEWVHVCELLRNEMLACGKCKVPSNICSPTNVQMCRH